jgi:hypothetical protein
MRLFFWLPLKGTVRYVKASPHIVGTLKQLAHGSYELCYCYNKEVWDGWRWKFVERLEKTREQWNQQKTT